jgi:syntaxin-binding protein 5
MKKFTFKGVLDGFRSSVQAAPRGVEQEIQETLRSDHFQIKKVSCRIIARCGPRSRR